MEAQQNFQGLEQSQPVPPSVPSSPSLPEPPLTQPELTPEILAALKAKAKQDAIQQYMEQRAALGNQLQQPQPQFAPPKVVYVRRNLTVAELILIFALSCGSVLGIQAAWNFASNFLPSIEIKVK
jgi:hypothetical protein